MVPPPHNILIVLTVLFTFGIWTRLCHRSYQRKKCSEVFPRQSTVVCVSDVPHCCDKMPGASRCGGRLLPLVRGQRGSWGSMWWPECEVVVTLHPGQEAERDEFGLAASCLLFFRLRSQHVERCCPYPGWVFLSQLNFSGNFLTDTPRRVSLKDGCKSTKLTSEINCNLLVIDSPETFHTDLLTLVFL